MAACEILMNRNTIFPFFLNQEKVLKELRIHMHVIVRVYVCVGIFTC